MSTSWVVDDLVDEASELFDGPLDGLVAVLEEIASLGDVETPTPSAELALLLAGRPAETRRPVRRSHRRLAPVLGGLAAAAVTGLTLTGTAAYANELPPSMQRVVAHLSEDYLPFTFPRAGRRPAGSAPRVAARSGRTVITQGHDDSWHRAVRGGGVPCRADRPVHQRWPHRPGRRTSGRPGRQQAQTARSVRGTAGTAPRADPVRRRPVRGDDGRRGHRRTGVSDVAVTLALSVPGALGRHRRAGVPGRPAGLAEWSAGRDGARARPRPLGRTRRSPRRPPTSRRRRARRLPARSRRRRQAPGRSRPSVRTPPTARRRARPSDRTRPSTPRRPRLRARRPTRAGASRPDR